MTYDVMAERLQEPRQAFNVELDWSPGLKVAGAFALTH